jgi:hypothetical protein
MSLFRRQKPANDAGSTSVPTAGNFVGVFGSWLSRKGQKAQPNAGSIPSSAADSPAQRGRHDGRQIGKKWVLLSHFGIARIPPSELRMRDW